MCHALNFTDCGGAAERHGLIWLSEITRLGCRNMRKKGATHAQWLNDALLHKRLPTEAANTLDHQPRHDIHDVLVLINRPKIFVRRKMCQPLHQFMTRGRHLKPCLVVAWQARAMTQ